MYNTIFWWCIFAAMLSCTLGFLFLRYIKQFVRSSIRAYVNEIHQAKELTPTMGGLFFIGAFLITLLCSISWSNSKVWIIALTTIGFGAVGFCDDWFKIVRHKGITEKQKFISQFLIALLALLIWFFWEKPSTLVHIPFLPHLSLNINWLLIPWGIWILLSSTNAVNITDGLDGLAGSLVAIVSAVFGIIAWLQGDYSLALIAWIFASTLLGFLWFNSCPAKVFMGDVGSLACGGFIGMIALMTRQELLLPIVAGVMVIEVLSVIMQVSTFKLTGRRILKMAPLHHHFELCGIPETKITTRCILITMVLGLVALAGFC
ncbi:MAG: phospho-N-acetylmuramoyl-pentapeptide-transferase [Candidatus Babeliaceae bacterium]|nr:phospho-N-acetylmuramoyl-pentapeptide-transferase [Candidatus Babeliaceae bacterium]